MREILYVNEAKVSWNFIDPGHRVRDEDINRKLPIGRVDRLVQVNWNV